MAQRPPVSGIHHALQVGTQVAPLLDKVASADNVERAGIDESDLSPTQNTKLLPHGILFSVTYTEDGPFVHRGLDVSYILGERALARNTARALTGSNEMDAKENSLASHIRGMMFGLRFNPEEKGPYLVKSHEPITLDDVQRLIDSMSRDRLKTFLQRAKI